MTKSTLSFVVLIVGISQAAWAQKFFENEAKAIPTYRTKHAFCYREQDSDDLLGTNVNGAVRLASTSKLITSLWAVSKLGPDFRYTTRAYYKPETKELFIDGNGDPYFSRLKAYALMSELIKKNINSVSTLHFSKKVDYNRDIDCGTSYAECSQVAIAEWTSRGGIPRDAQMRGLQSALNPARWNAAEKNYYVKAIAQAHARGFEMLPANKVKFEVKSVVDTDTNPFDAEIQGGSKDIVIYEMKSAPMYRYLKHMNVNSINWTADKIFDSLGGAEEFKEFSTKIPGFAEQSTEINNGSGLNLGDDYPNRKDNYTTCSSMISIMAALDEQLEKSKSKYSIEDLVMVSGVDSGTFTGVYAGEYLSRAVIAKTGTLKNAATLAGFVRTQKGLVYFGMFFQTLSISQARAARDRLVQRLIKEYGGPARSTWKASGPFLSFDAKSVLTEVTAPEISNSLR